MGSDEERLEEMLKAVMETEKEKEEEMPIEDLPDILFEDLPDIPFEDIAGMPFENDAEDLLEEIPEKPVQTSEKASVKELTDGAAAVEAQAEKPDKSEEKQQKQPAGEPEVDPLELLSMSEEEIDEVLEKEAALENGSFGKPASGSQKRKSADLQEPVKENSDLSDIEELLQMSDNHVQVAPDGAGDVHFDAPKFEDEEIGDISGDKSAASENGKDLLSEKEKGKKKEKKPKEKKQKEKKQKEKKQKEKGEKEGFGKKLAAMFFGSDDDEAEEEEKGKAAEGDDKAAAGKKKKKEKKKEPPKKKEPDPKKAAKEKQKKEKNAEKAKIKAEKAAQAEKEKRAAKKLPKKKVIVWVLFCTSIGVGILLLNSIGMSTIELSEARSAFEEKDFATAYRLLNGRELAEEDQLLFRQSSAVLHLEHAVEAYTNHLKLKKPVLALEDLLKGVNKYQELLQNGEEELVTSELTAQYQSILAILQEQYNLSEEGALEINAIEEDYEYSLQLEALAGGEVYQSQAEIEREQEEAASAFPELEDMLPGEEEFLDVSGN